VRHCWGPAVAPQLLKLGLNTQSDTAQNAHSQLLETQKNLKHLRRRYQKLHKDHHNLIGEFCGSESSIVLSGEFKCLLQFFLVFWVMFPWAAYLTNICHFWILATLWEQCTCTSAGDLFISHQLFVNVTQVAGITSVYFLKRLRLIVVFPELVYTGRSDKWLVSVYGQSVSFSASSAQVHEFWESVTVTRQTFEQCTWVQMFGRWIIHWNSATVIHLTLCTVHSYWHCCQIHKSWEPGFLEVWPSRLNEHGHSLL
jgi:hypothetical protein